MRPGAPGNIQRPKLNRRPHHQRDEQVHRRRNDASRTRVHHANSSFRTFLLLLRPLLLHPLPRSLLYFH